MMRLDWNQNWLFQLDDVINIFFYEKEIWRVQKVMSK